MSVIKIFNAKKLIEDEMNFRHRILSLLELHKNELEHELSNFEKYTIHSDAILSNKLEELRARITSLNLSTGKRLSSLKNQSSNHSNLCCDYFNDNQVYPWKYEN